METVLPLIGLVVGEDPGTVEFYEEVLSVAGCWVASSSPREAVEYALDLQPEIIVADLDLRREDAQELIEHWQAEPKLARAALILITDDASAIRRDGIAIVPKPVSTTGLLDRIQDLIRISRPGRGIEGTNRAVPIVPAPNSSPAA